MNSIPLLSIPHRANRRTSLGQRCRVPLLLVFLLLLNPWASASAATSLKDVTYAALPGDEVRIELQLSAAARQPKVWATDNPARIVLDLAGVTSGLDKKTVPIAVGPVQSLVAVESTDRTRVVINLSNPVTYQVDTRADKVNIALNAAQASPAPRQAASRPAAGVSRPRPAPAGAGEGIKDIDFRRGPNGEGRVLITLPSPETRVSVTEKGKRVIALIADTKLPARLMRRLDVTDFATPVIAVESRPSDNGVEVSIETTTEYEYLAYQADELFTLEFSPLTEAEQEERRAGPVVYTGDRLSLNFQNIKVRAVLHLLADFTGLNFVISDSVGGSITLRLKNVPWDQALDVVLRSKNLSMRRNDTVLWIAPTPEIVRQEQAELAADRKFEELAPLRTEFIRLQYAKASEIKALLQKGQPGSRAGVSQLSEAARVGGFVTSLGFLSERGSVLSDNRTNTLIVTDTAEKIETIRRAIEKLDISVRQVLIESRVVIANNDFARDLGVRFGYTKTNFNPPDKDFSEFTGGLPGNIENSATFAGSLISTAGDATPLLVDLPVASPSGAVQFIMGKIGSYLLQLELSAMQREGRGEVISSPRVVTADNEEAVIKVGQEIPYQVSAGASGATAIQYKDAVLSLTVTPQITPDDRVIMDLKVTKDNPVFLAPGAEPAIDTRAVETNVLVDNGETVVLGGVFERDKSSSKEQVPWLGDIPVLGNLFKTTSKRVEDSELLIFVTPKILKEELAAR
jgi:type IV pilus assembly protein PilQ